MKRHVLTERSSAVWARQVKRLRRHLFRAVIIPASRRPAIQCACQGNINAAHRHTRQLEGRLGALRLKMRGRGKAVHVGWATTCYPLINNLPPSHLKSDAIKTEKHKYVRKQIHKKILQACGQSGLHLCPHNFLPESLLSVSQGRKIQTGCSGWLDIASAAQNEACYQDPAHVQGLRIEGRFAALLSPFIQRSCDLVEIDPCQSAVQPD